MTRKEFVAKLPIGAALAFGMMCGGGCHKRLMEEVRQTTSLPTDSLPSPWAIVDFRINLNDPMYAVLNRIDGYAYYGDVIIANTMDHGYIAATKICSDEFLPRIIWENGEWLCEAHGATFDVHGVGTDTFNTLGENGIAVYTVEQNGSELHIFS